MGRGERQRPSTGAAVVAWVWLDSGTARPGGRGQIVKALTCRLAGTLRGDGREARRSVGAQGATMARPRTSGWVLGREGTFPGGGA